MVIKCTLENPISEDGDICNKDQYKGELRKWPQSDQVLIQTLLQSGCTSSHVSDSDNSGNTYLGKSL